MKKTVTAVLLMWSVLSTAANDLPSKFRLDDVDGKSYLTPVKSQATADDRSYSYAPMDCLEAMWLITSKTPYSSLTPSKQAALIGPHVQAAADAHGRSGDKVRDSWDGWPCALQSMNWILHTGIAGRYVTDVLFFDGIPYSSQTPDTAQWRSAIDDIKDTIVNYGPVVAQYQHDDEYMNGAYYRFPEYVTLSSEGPEFTRSAVIIGYDDSVPASKFTTKGKGRDIGNGAWIVKGSHGTSSGDDGYFYISYYDQSFLLSSVLGLYPSCFAYIFRVDIDHEYDRFYGHDFESPSGWEMMGYYSYAAMFTAESDGAIGAIGVMSLADFWEGSFKVSAFVGCSEGNPVSGAQVLNRERYDVYAPGYRTIKLKNPFAVKKGQRFSIIIDRLAGHAVMNTANPVPGRCFRGTIKYNSDPVTKYEWNDMADGVEIDGFGEANACYVTAYTVYDEDARFEVRGEPIDGGRLLALSTEGCDCFWEDVESKVGLPRTMFTAAVDAIPVTDELNSECHVGIAPEAGDYSFAIEAPEKWTVKSDCAWIRTKSTGGVKGSSSIAVTVEANMEGIVRSGNLVFTCDGETRTFTIVQDVMPKVLDWHLCGKDTEKEQDRVTGDPVGDPCLVADRRLVVKLQFSHFNRERYRIDSLKVSGVPNPALSENPAKNDISLDWQQILNAANPIAADPTYAVELVSDQKLPKGVGCHGLYDFMAEVSCERIGRINVVDEKCPVTKKVFFDKYKRDNGSEPNWFVYWSMDGAVPALVECSGKYSTVEGAPVIHRIAELDENGKYVSRPNSWGSANTEKGTITLYDKAANGHYFYSFSSLAAGGIDFREDWVYGIYTVANVLAHERQHIDTYNIYKAELKAVGVTYPDDLVLSLKIVDIKTFNQDFEGDGAGSYDLRTIWMMAGDYIWVRKRPADDHLTNSREELLKLTDRSKVDTFDLAHKKNDIYAKDGDDEFMSMLAGYRANEDPNTAIEEKDWAYPGHQSYLPLVNGQKVPRKSNKSVSSSDGVQRKSAQKMPLQIAQGEVEPFLASNGVIVAVNGDAAAKGEADALRYKLSFDVTGSETMRFVGYLIDPASNVVACAGVDATLSAVDNSCELAFPTNDIFRSGFSGPYTLSGMIVYRVCNTEYVCEGVYRDLVTDWVSVEPPNPVDEYGIASRYGPFVPGEKVELRFPEGAAWKVTGLPTGLKWDAKLPGVTGVPTKPGTNTVTFTWTDKSVTPNVTHKASSTFIVGPLPVLSVRTAGEGTGKVTGAGAYAANKKVTLKATADTKDAAAKGKNPATVKSVFAGWYDAAGGLVAQTPSLSYVMPPYDAALQARFIPASNDWATADCVTDAGSVLVVSNETKVAIAPISVIAAGGSLPTVKVAGLPSGLKFTAKNILKKGSKTEVDIPANTIYGTPTKGGVYNATVTVTTAGKASTVRAIKFIIRTSSDYVVDADWDPVQGKVTGAGVYQAGKKVTLKATANKGYVFSAWYDGEGAVATRAASYVIDKMPSNDVELVAAFVTSDEDKASVAAVVNGMAFGAGSGGEGAAVTKRATNVWAGVYLEWPVAASALSETTVKVSGLPSGLKFTAKPVTSKVGSGKTAVTVTNVAANTIYGAPTAASKTDKNGNVTPSKVKVTVTTAGKNSQVYQIDTTVDPLPAWAVGTFAGPSYEEGLDGEGAVVTQTNGAVSVTVAASGKISAKQPVAGKATSFAANYFDAYDGESFWATLTAKVGKEVVTNEMTVMKAEASEMGFIAADRFDAWQYNWKVEPWKTIGKSFEKKTLTYYIAVDGTIVDENDETSLAALGGGQGLTVLPVDGTNVIGRVTLKFAASGSVSVAGEFVTYDTNGNIAMKNGKPVTVKATGSATLLPTDETHYLVFVYLAPKNLLPHARCVEIGE